MDPPGRVPPLEGMLTDDLGRITQLVTSTTRIAAVGSSGNLRYRQQGVEIDSHDIVIRTNAAIVHSYAEDVGRRTDWRVVWEEGLANSLNLDLINENTIVLSTCFGLQQEDVTCIDPALVDATRARGAVYLTLSHGWVVQRLWQEALGAPHWQMPSTGFVSIGVAVALTQAVGAPPPWRQRLARGHFAARAPAPRCA